MSRTPSLSERAVWSLTSLAPPLGPLLCRAAAVAFPDPLGALGDVWAPEDWGGVTAATAAAAADATAASVGLSCDWRWLKLALAGLWLWLWLWL